MNLIYPVSIKIYPNGQVGAFFPDVPEAISSGTTEAMALDNAQDALVVALSGYLDDSRVLPVPSKAKRGQRVIAVPPRVAIKLAIHDTMRQLKITQTQLGDRLGIDARQVRRILDIDHESKLSHLELALAALGLRMDVSVSKVSPVSSNAAA